MANQWVAHCKDCGNAFHYSDASHQADAVRGYSPPERCEKCRPRHAREIRTVGMSHYPIRRITDRVPAPGRLGRIHHDVQKHTYQSLPSNFNKYRFGITDLDILRVYASLGARFEITPEVRAQIVGEQVGTVTAATTSEVWSNDIEFRNAQVLVIEGPTGSGKSTLLPYRLLVPPAAIGDSQYFTRRGPVIITQPRTQPTRDIPRFVAEQLHGSGVGPGYDIGFKHHNANETDRRNRLIYVTDGTLINWIINEQISEFSVIMIDEAHERSLNIDLILGLLKARLPRYPHLKLIIASATIAAEDFINYYGGSECVAHLKFKGMAQPVEEHFAPIPVFDYENLLRKPSLAIDEIAAKAVETKVLEVLNHIVSNGPTAEGDILAFLHSENSIDRACEMLQAAIKKDKRLGETQVFRLYRNIPQGEQDQILMNKSYVIANKIKAYMRQVLGGKQYTLGPILALVLDKRTAEDVYEVLQRGLEGDQAQQLLQHSTIAIAHEEMEASDLLRLSMSFQQARGLYILISTYKAHAQVDLVSPHMMKIEDRRVIISTNVAETSLTVDGVVYVVDSGLIKQTSWDAHTLTKGLVSKKHSQAGCLQRKGRAGRIRPGHAYFLYTQTQMDQFEPYTPPEIKRAPLEAVVLSAKAAGVSDITTFDWFQRTPEMDAELARSQQALVARRLLDKDNDITEHGLELHSLALDAGAANLLMTADRFACALEVATLIPMILMSQTIQGGLLKWDKNWDAATRWEVKRRQYGLRGGCVDDLDLCMKIFAAWEASGSEEAQRREWARYYFVNHDLLATSIAADRAALLDRLAISTKGNAARPIDFDILDRVRIVLAYSLPDQIGSSDEYLIAPESTCYGQTIPLMVYGRRIPFRILREGRPAYQVSLIVRLKPYWRDVVNLSPFELGRFIAQETRSNNGGALYRSPIWQHLPLLCAPLGATYSCQLPRSAGESLVLQRRLKDPAPVYEQVTGLYLHEDIEVEQLEIVEPRRSQAKAKTYIIEEAIDSTLDEDQLVEQLPRMRLICPQPPLLWQKVDIYVDGEVVVRDLLVTDGLTKYIELPVGEHELQITPSRGYSGSDSSIRFNHQLLEASDYSVIIGSWNERNLPFRQLVQDQCGPLQASKAQLRWVLLGRFNPPIDVLVNNYPAPPRKYRTVDGHRTSLFEAYSKGGKQRGEQPLLREILTVRPNERYTVIVTPHGKEQTPQITLVEEKIRSEKSVAGAVASVWNTRAEVQIPEWFPSVSLAETFNILVTGYDYNDPYRPLVYALPLTNRAPFERFVEYAATVEEVDVIPVAIESFPERRRYALIVREAVTHIEIAVDATELAFADWGIEYVLQDLMRQERIKMAIGWIDNRHERIYLTRLPLLDAELMKLLETSNKITALATVREVLLQQNRPGLIVTFEAKSVLHWGAFIHAEQVAQTAIKLFSEFQPGERFMVQLRFNGGRAKIDAWSEEVQAALLQSNLDEIEMSFEDGEIMLSLDRPMSFVECERLLTANNKQAYREAIWALYRNSNHPQVDIIDLQKLAIIDQRYPVGVIVQGCVVNRILNNLVELKIEPTILGSIHVSEWSNEYIQDITSETNIGDKVDGLVLQREENGFLRLSRKRAAITEYQVNARYMGIIEKINENGVVVRLTQTEQSKPVRQSISGFVHKSQVRFIPTNELAAFHPGNILQQGQQVMVRIISIDYDKVKISISMCRLFETVLLVPPYAKIGNFIQALPSMVNNTHQIVVKREQGQEGIITIYSLRLADHTHVIQKVKSQVSGVQERHTASPKPAPYARVMADPTGSGIQQQTIAKKSTMIGKGSTQRLGKGSSIGIGVAVGICTGIVFSLLFNNIILGLLIGAALGVIISVIWYKSR